MDRILCFAPVFFSTIMIAGAQTAPPAAVSPSLKGLSIEAVIPIDSIEAISVPAIPAEIIAGLTSGTMELHQQAIYDAAAKTLKVTGLLENAGSPVPTPSGATGVTPVWSYTVSVDRVELASTPSNAVVFLGSVAAGVFRHAVWGHHRFSGHSVGKLQDPVDPAPAANTAYSGISTNIAGAASLFSKSGAGTIGLGTTATGMPTAVAGPKNTISPTPQFQLDASKSTDPNGGTLTYHWAYVPAFGMTATITGADTATPMVTVPDYSNAQGDYTFQLTVTNAAGLSSTDTVVVTYDVSQAPVF